MTGLALAREVGIAWPSAVDAAGPASFAERGVAVAFTTPALALCRLRRDGRGYLEIVKPNSVDGRGVYIVPWAALPEIMAVTIHDRMLHREIVWRATIDPESIRLAQLRIARQGFAGAAAVPAATRALTTDDRIAAAVNLALVVRLIHAGGLSSAAAWQATESGRADAEFKRALSSIAGRIGVGALELADRLAQLSARIGPLGLPPPHPPGRLRRLLHALADFRAAIAAWGRSEGGPDGDVAGLCGEVAGDAVERCRAVVDALDRRLASPTPTLRAWPRESRLIDDSRLRLAWLLDGWQRAIVMWQDARDAPRPDQAAAVGVILRGLPLLPRDEGPSGAAGDLGHAHRRLMRRHGRFIDERKPGYTAAELVRRAELANLRAEFL